MAVTEYIGARYVPLFAEPIEWDNVRDYEPLTIVVHEGNSYTSKQHVPAGIDISNESFWALTGNYNAQVEQYRRDAKTALSAAQGAVSKSTENAAKIAANSDKIGVVEKAVATVNDDVTALAADTASEIGTVKTSVSKVESDLTKEVTDRATEYANLDAAINREITARVEGDDDRYTKEQADARFMQFGAVAYADVVADYGADKSGDTYSDAAIQQALDSDDTYVYFPKGTYKLDRYLRVPSDKVLIGYGAKFVTDASSWINNNGTSGQIMLTNKTDGAAEYSANSNIQLYGMDFSNTGHTTTLVGFGHCDKVKIVDCTFHDIDAWHMVEFNACQNSLVDNCFFYNYGSTGSASTEMLQIDSAISGGPWPWFGVYDNTPCRNITISNCTFANSHTTSTSAYRPAAIGTHNTAPSKYHESVKVVNNTCSGLRTFVIMINTRNMLVANNAVRECSGGVYLSGANYYCNITGNRLNGEGWSESGNGGRAITFLPSGSDHVWGAKIEGNYITDFNGHGIACQGELINVTDNVVANCGGHGIYAGYSERGGWYTANCAYSNGSNVSNGVDLYVNASTENLNTIGDIVFAGNKCSKAIVQGTFTQYNVFANNYCKTSATISSATHSANNIVAGKLSANTNV